MEPTGFRIVLQTWPRIGRAFSVFSASHDDAGVSTRRVGGGLTADAGAGGRHQHRLAVEAVDTAAEGQATFALKNEHHRDNGRDRDEEVNDSYEGRDSHDPSAALSIGD